MAKSETNPQLLTTAKRRAFVLQYRRGGATYQQIAKKAIGHFGAGALPKGWDERYAWKDVKRELDRLRNDMAEDAEEVRQMELERLLELQRALWGKAQKGDERAVDRVLKIMKRRADLLGLDAPVKTDITTDGEPIKQYVSISPDDWEKEKE